MSCLWDAKLEEIEMQKIVGYRKLIAFILSLIILTILSLLGKLEQNSAWCLIGLFSAFSAPNMIEHIFKGKNGKVSKFD